MAAISRLRFSYLPGSKSPDVLMYVLFDGVKSAEPPIIDGMASAVAMVPEARFGVVVLTNLGSGILAPTALARQIVDMQLGRASTDWSRRLRLSYDSVGRLQRAAVAAFAARRVPDTKPSLRLAAYAGTYGDRTVEVVDGMLVARRGNRPALRLVPVGPNLFAPDAAPAQRFGFIAEGDRAVALEIDTGTGPQRLDRVG